MRTYHQCLACFERQAADVCRMAKLGPEATREVMAAIKKRVAGFPRTQPPIVAAVEIHELVRLKSGVRDPYARVKQVSNDECSKMVPQLERWMADATHPLETAVKLAIAGNIIDYGALRMREISSTALSAFVEQVIEEPLEGNSVEEFRHLLETARRILYLADNAGECFFDVPLLGLLPAGRVTYAVRGGPVLNDATLPDAQAAGIPDRYPVITTGDHAPGILRERCSSEFRHAFDGSDLIVSKGQGNYESLSDFSQKRIVFLTKVKCPVIAGEIGFPLGSSVIRIVDGNGTSGN